MRQQLGEILFSHGISETLVCFVVDLIEVFLVQFLMEGIGKGCGFGAVRINRPYQDTNRVNQRNRKRGHNVGPCAPFLWNNVRPIRDAAVTWRSSHYFAAVSRSAWSCCSARTFTVPRWIAAMPSAAAMAAESVVIVGMREVIAARRMAFSSKNVSAP